MKPTSLLIVDDEESIIKLFERLARQEKLSYLSASNGQTALDYLQQHTIECVVLDLHLPERSGFQILEALQSFSNPPQVMVVTGSGSVEQAVKALKLGAFDYMSKPLEDLNKVTHTIRNAIEKYRLVQKVQALQEPNASFESYQGLVGRSSAMQEVYALIDSLKSSSSTVLIEGESGTGKEMVAKAIHQTSPRAREPFKVINCAAIPEGLLESELFGHVRGAFTGALYDKAGLFEAAHDGTIFLDEIGEVSPAFQVKLLRVLQGGEYKRVGSSEMRHTNVRVLSATNQNLKQLITQGKFREDLYYRLHVIGISLPSLRERKEDIPLLAYYFLKKYNEKLKKQIREISPDAMKVLQTHEWVGNVRELENIIERCTVLVPGEVIRAKDLPPQLLSQKLNGFPQDNFDFSNYSYQQAKSQALLFFNRSYIYHLLKQTGGNITLASDRAGMDRSNFKKILKKYDINVREFRKG